VVRAYIKERSSNTGAKAKLWIISPPPLSSGASSVNLLDHLFHISKHVKIRLDNILGTSKNDPDYVTDTLMNLWPN